MVSGCATLEGVDENKKRDNPLKQVLGRSFLGGGGVWSQPDPAFTALGDS